MVPKQRPFNTDFNFGNKKKSQGARSAEEGGQSSDFWHKTYELTRLSGQAHCHDERIIGLFFTAAFSELVYNAIKNRLLELSRHNYGLLQIFSKFRNIDD